MLRRSACCLAKDPFKALGLTRTATKTQVKAKYRELAKVHHPDAANGSATKMEEINRAYNLLMKEGAYERLHLSGAPRPAPGKPSSETAATDSGLSSGFQRRQTAPFSHDDNLAGNSSASEDYSKVSALDSETERVTPDGKFMYQNRDSGEWVTLERPLVRANQPRFRSFSQQSSQAEAAAAMREELRRRREEQERVQNMKTSFQRAVDHLNDGCHLPTRNKYTLFVAFLVVLASIRFVYRKTVAFLEKKRYKREFYDEIDRNRARGDALYQEHPVEVEALVLAAALVMLAAASKKSEWDPVAPTRGDEHYNNIRPPKRHFEIIAGN